MDVRGGSLHNQCWWLERAWHVVTWSLRPGWPKDDLSSGQEADRRAGWVRNRMSGFRGVGSRRVVARGTLLSRSHLWVSSELLGRRWREVGVDIAEGR